jgi:hypothetical protein
MILGKKTAYAISAAILCVIVGAFIYAAVINPIPAQQVPRVVLTPSIDAGSLQAELEVARIQLPEGPSRQSMQWACFSLSLQPPDNSSIAVNLGDLVWAGNETGWLSLWPGYELCIKSTPGNVSGMRVGDVICMRATDPLTVGQWQFVLSYFPPGMESGRTSITIQASAQ